MTDFFNGGLYRQQNSTQQSVVRHENLLLFAYKGADLLETPGNEAGDIWVKALDLSTGQWEDSVRIASPRFISFNEELTPSITVDKDGFIHVVYGGNERGRDFGHLISGAPGDYTQFFPSSFPSNVGALPTIMGLSDRLAMVYRGSNGQDNPLLGDWFISYSVDGQAWDPPVKIAEAGDDSWVLNPVAQGDTVHIGFSFHDIERVFGPDFENTYYAKIVDGQITDIAGNVIPVITKEVADSESNELLAHSFVGESVAPSIDVTAGGKVYLSNGYVENGINKYFSSFDGSQWQSTKVDTTAGRPHFNTQTAVYENDGVLELFSIGEYGEGLNKQISSDGGETWSAPQTILETSVWDFEVIPDAPADAYLFATEQGDFPNRNAIVYGNNGFVSDDGIDPIAPQRETIKFEFEDLSFSGSDRALVRERGRGTTVQLNADSIGDSITFELPDELNLTGRYEVRYSGRSRRDGGRVATYLDGDNQSVLLSKRSGYRYNSRVLNFVDEIDFGLGVTADSIRVEVLNKNYRSTGFRWEGDSIEFVPVFSD